MTLCETDLRVQAITIDVSSLLVILTALLMDLVEVTGIKVKQSLASEQLHHPLCYPGVLGGGSLHDRAGPPVAVCEEQFQVLRERVVIILPMLAIRMPSLAIRLPKLAMSWPKLCFVYVCCVLCAVCCVL